MALSRAIALRNLRTRISTAPTRLLRQTSRRGYAASGHEHAKPQSDALWATGALAVTITGTYFILSSGSTDSHSHGGHGDHDKHDGHHGQEHEIKDEKSARDEDEGESESMKGQEGIGEDQAQSAQSKANVPEDSSDEMTSDEALTPDSSEDDSEIQDDDESNVRMNVPDAKAGSKTRIQSKSAIKQGELSEEAAQDSSKPDDTASSSKSTGNQYSQSAKQEGLTNTDTKHSTDIENNSDKSKKGDGSPETSKAKGTVDVNQKLK